MAFTTGTATDHNDLLDKLRLYLVSEGWTEQDWTAGATIADSSTLFVQGPGAGADKRVNISIQSQYSAAIGSYSWQIRAATDYNGSLPFGSQPGTSPSSCYFNIWENAITYWFFVNDRRFVVVAKCSTNYISMHAGFFLPWGIPDDYPLPLFVAADFYEPQTVSYSNAARRMFVDPGHPKASGVIASAWARSPTGIWYPFGNNEAGGAVNRALSLTKGAKGIIWPYNCGSSTPSSSTLQFELVAWNGGIGAGANSYAFEGLVPTQQNERPLLPISLLPFDQTSFGTLDGVYCVGGSGLATEQVISIGGRDFMIFQNINRNSPDDFFCVEEI